MSPFAAELPTLPFFVLKTLFDQTPLTTDDGVVLRRMTLDIGVIHLVLACLSVLGHHAPRQPIPGFHQEVSCTSRAFLYYATVARNNSVVTLLGYFGLKVFQHIWCYVLMSNFKLQTPKVHCHTVPNLNHN